jgi:cephalosporin hydroxylase
MRSAMGVPARLRTALVDRADAIALARARVLADRAGRGVGRRTDELATVLRGLASGRRLSPAIVDAIAGVIAGLWDRLDGTVDPSPSLRRAIVDQFSRLYYHPGDSTWRQTRYRGLTVWKCPLDLWIYQEIISEIRPSLIVETGTAHGGSALFLADLCATLGRGEVVTIDIRRRAEELEHERLTKIVGSSVDVAVRDDVVTRANGGPTLVVLDSDHRRDHVLAELRLWSDVVTPGSYLIVEDTNIDGRPVFPGFGPGPAEAVDTFVSEDDRFEIDRSREKFVMTWNPGGFLRRIR